MNKRDQGILKWVASALGDLNDEVVFVGGITTSAYIQDEVSPNITATEDVDLIANVTTRMEFNTLEKRLNKRGFKRNISKPGPMCRFYLGDLEVDAMPLDEKILGFSNRWYKPGYENSIELDLDGMKVRILSFEYYLATKFEAFQSRGSRGALWESKDFEDLVVVLNGRLDLQKDLESFAPVTSDFIQKAFKSITAEKNRFLEVTTACLGDLGPAVASAKAGKLFDLLQKCIE